MVSNLYPNGSTSRVLPANPLTMTCPWLSSLQVACCWKRSRSTSRSKCSKLSFEQLLLVLCISCFKYPFKFWLMSSTMEASGPLRLRLIDLLSSCQTPSTVQTFWHGSELKDTAHVFETDALSGTEDDLSLDKP